MYLMLTQRGSELLVLYGYKYSKYKLTKIGQNWRCTHKHSCNSSVTTGWTGHTRDTFTREKIDQGVYFELYQKKTVEEISTRP